MQSAVSVKLQGHGKARAGAQAPNATEAAMEERRKIQRGRTLKGGSIAINRASGFDCRVRNMSPAGACLEVASQIGIPDDFVLVVSSDRVKQPCRVIWRADTRLGVQFLAA
jgi:hypothetical protein